MTTSASPVSAGSVVVSAGPLRLAVNAYLARFKGISREHTCSDLNAFVTWCTERGVQPLAARRGDLELFVRWMQETRRLKAVHGGQTDLGGGRVLPHLRHRRCPGPFTGRICAAPERAG